jgi:hypothetical protein
MLKKWMLKYFREEIMNEGDVRGGGSTREVEWTGDLMTKEGVGFAGKGGVSDLS